MTTPPRIIRTVDTLQALSAEWHRAGLRVGMVPTMGALHSGHLALVEAARARAERIIVTIFVNPAQFAPTEDFAAYPRTEASDVEKLAALGVEAVFAPNAAEMYPAGFATTITLKGPALGLETDFRPHFFAGVATVVAKLLIAGFPDVALFGEKDYQQLAVVTQLVADLRLPTEIIGLPTIREADGLALSSRNAYLTAEERAVAPILAATLQEIAAGIRSGQPAAALIEAGTARLVASGFRTPDYLTLRNARTLAEPVDLATEPLRLLVAAWLGRTRLIDNIAV
ncbi:pantoate--beta-alanine ligase [Kaistia dalseonensis]|uniref:Pantothenate synthetase n=1 Tax=Kaistia dalseonensis TaxID=410840 RepID=A0ABU0H165_9HYPH|nr:pantoate--beta-alanine ligase [Kaistia dalseonensis]MCX5493478.1 pantoate--beta-alanine ligase [Kaistia dalseonensis]MDQ0436037.1 pantoate--beta-alanine ligase [Kaistia dalseonensis]